MLKFLPKNRKLRVPFILAVLVIVLCAGAAVAKWVAYPRFLVWREKRSNEVARDLFVKGDLNGAILAVRKSLTYNPRNIDAWRLGAEIAEKQNSQDIVFYQQHLAENQPTLENKVKFIRLAVKYNAFSLASEAVGKVGPEGATSADFLELAAQVARRTGNQTKAKYFLMSLLSLKPDNTAARFDLAQIRLFEGVAENKPAIRAEIQSISNDPAYRVRGLTLLLADALETKTSADALSFADKLALSADTPATTQIYVAEAYRRYAPAKSKDFIKHLEDSYANEANKVIILVNYLSANEMASEARQWVESLPEKVRAVEGVQLNYAFTLLILKDWNTLDSFLRTAKWTENEFARHAILAYRYRINGNERDFAEEWRLATIDVGNSPRKLQTLLAQASTWNWEDQKYELLWKRFMIDPRNAEVRQALALYEVQKGHTANLNRLFARLIEIDPKDNDAKNNFAYTSMLLGINLDRAYQMAEEVYNSNSRASKDFYATTYSFALYKQGKMAEALNVLQGYGTTDLSRSVRPLLLAVYMVANGKVDDGLALAKHVDLTKLLPEERRLMNDVNAMSEKSQRQQKSNAQLASLSAMPSSTTGDKKSWLATLPPQYKKTTPVNMELADSLYANDDYPGLETTLRGDKWEQNDFLRLALLTYAQRSQGKEADAKSTWRSATVATNNRADNLHALADMAERWNWAQERVEVLTRIYQREPSDSKAFDELVDFYNRNGQTTELAHLYEVRIEAIPTDTDAKSHFAYYNLLVGSNLSRAHVMAKEGYDAANDNSFRTKVYAFSLIKQSRGTEAVRVLEKIANDEEGGQAQLTLLKAALAVQQNNPKQARSYLDAFKPAGALPEESALADSLAKSLAKDA